MFGPYLPAHQEAVETARAEFERAQRARRQAENFERGDVLCEVQNYVVDPERPYSYRTRRGLLRERIAEKAERAADALREALFPVGVIPVRLSWSDGTYSVWPWSPAWEEPPFLMSRAEYDAYQAHLAESRAWDKRFTALENGGAQ